MEKEVKNLLKDKIAFQLFCLMIFCNLSDREVLRNIARVVNMKNQAIVDILNAGKGYYPQEISLEAVENIEKLLITYQADEFICSILSEWKKMISEMDAFIGQMI